MQSCGIVAGPVGVPVRAMVGASKSAAPLGALPRRTQALTSRVSRSRPSSRRAVSVAANYGGQWATPQDAYLTVGLAHCYEKDDNGKVRDVIVIEPISANSLECMANGGRTCFTAVFSLTLEEALAGKANLPAEFQDGVICENFAARCDACARTWMRQHAMDNLLSIVPLGQTVKSFNYDTTDKRVLNMENVVDDSDNIKQDISIDVYGRKEVEALKKDEGEGEAAAAEEEEEDEMDSLLAG
jgi:hypothetical protein